MKIKHHESRNTAGVAMEAARLSKENDYFDDNFNELQKQGNRVRKREAAGLLPPPPHPAPWSFLQRASRSSQVAEVDLGGRKVPCSRRVLWLVSSLHRHVYIDQWHEAERSRKNRRGRD